ncbi:MAG TPA: hypothetical protein VKS25_09720 [Solirubrobacteraceae bacterium]|nr:hypothetical protein [Solirubrobacteraceae bacterium]
MPAEPRSSGEWPREVGCVLYEAGAAAVFIDPLVPEEDEQLFWEWADARCEGRSVAVLETVRFHGRSGAEVIVRYGAGTAPPGGLVEALEFPAADETMFWLHEHSTLVPGDRLLGAEDGSGALRLCPQSWLRYLDPPPSEAELAALLAPLLELDCEAVLVSHGEPVLSGGAAAIARALEAA